MRIAWAWWSLIGLVRILFCSFRQFKNFLAASRRKALFTQVYTFPSNTITESNLIIVPNATTHFSICNQQRGLNVPKCLNEFFTHPLMQNKVFNFSFVFSSAKWKEMVPKILLKKAKKANNPIMQRSIKTKKKSSLHYVELKVKYWIRS